MATPVDSKNRYIRDATYVVHFEKDIEMRLKQQQFERAFGPLFNRKESINTNTPDASHASRPRFIYSMNDKQLVVSQNHFQFGLKFDRHGLAEQERIKIIEKNIEDLETGLVAFLQGRQILDTGFVVSLNYPSDQADADMAALIYERFLKMPMRGAPATAEIKIGFKADDNHFLSLSVALYQKGEAILEVPAGAPIFFQSSDMKIEERGIELKFDLNDKPRNTQSNPPQRDPAEIRHRVTRFLQDEANSMLGVT